MPRIARLGGDSTNRFTTWKRWPKPLPRRSAAFPLREIHPGRRADHFPSLARPRPAGELQRPLRERPFPVGERKSPLRYRPFPAGECEIPLRERPLPAGECELPLRYTPLPKGEGLFPCGESPLPSRERRLPGGERRSPPLRRLAPARIVARPPEIHLRDTGPDSALGGARIPLANLRRALARADLPLAGPRSALPRGKPVPTAPGQNSAKARGRFQALCGWEAGAAGTAPGQSSTFHRPEVADLGDSHRTR